MAPGVVIAAGSAALAAAGALVALLQRRAGASNDKERSTTSSAGGGPKAYETMRAVGEYVQFHFGKDEDILPYQNGPKVREGWTLVARRSNNLATHAQRCARLLTFAPANYDLQEALNFMARCAQLVERHCDSLRDFNGEDGDPIAMDLGCAVGGASFALARAFPHVLGIDYSHAFVDAANVSFRAQRRRWGREMPGASFSRPRLRSATRCPLRGWAAGTLRSSTQQRTARLKPV